MVAEIAIGQTKHQPVAEDVEILGGLRRRDFFRRAVVRPIFDLTSRREIIGDWHNEIRLAGCASILPGKTGDSRGRARSNAKARVRWIVPVDVKLPNMH